jgi:hypothetical protein
VDDEWAEVAENSGDPLLHFPLPIGGREHKEQDGTFREVFIQTPQPPGAQRSMDATSWSSRRQS